MVERHEGKPVYDYLSSRNDGSIECHRWCAEINRPDADICSELSLSADRSGGKRNEEAGGEKTEGESWRTGAALSLHPLDGWQKDEAESGS